ncbi:MAG: hypothetical protein H6833_07110 [Planctomycetes bacterium]|nr:hypothetical protein [Planctomycetota bacterium]
MNGFAGSLLGLFSILFCSPALEAQVPICRIQGTESGDMFGWSVAGAGPYACIGATNDSVPGFPANTGSVLVLRATATGCQPAFPFPIPGSAPGDLFGHALTGVEGSYLVVGSPGADLTALQDAGRAQLLDLSTGATRLEILGDVIGAHTGTSLTSLGDVDGDGLEDFAVGMPGCNPVACTTFCRYTCYGGRFRVSSIDPNVGSGGNIVDVDGTGRCHNPGGLCRCYYSDELGTYASAIGDVDGDGHDELLMATPYLDLFSNTGRVQIVSLASQPPTVLSTDIGPWEYGKALCAIGDVNGDSILDYAAASPTNHTVWIKDVAGTTLHVIQHAQVGFGSELANVGDQDGDGVDDLLIGSPEEDNATGNAYLVSSARGHVLAVIHGRHAGGHFGHSLARLSDVTGDGRPEFLIGAPMASPPDATGFPMTSAGEAVLYTLDDLPPYVGTVGSPCAGPLASGYLPRIGTPDGIAELGRAFSLSVSHSLIQHTSLLVMGATPLQSSLGNCFVYASPDFFALVPLASVLTGPLGNQPGQGYGEVRFTMPSSPALAGQAAFAQWYVIDPSPFVVPGALSAGIRVQIR